MKVQRLRARQIKAIVEALMKQLNSSILVSDSMLDRFFGGEKAKDIDSEIDALVEEKAKLKRHQDLTLNLLLVLLLQQV